MGPMFPGVDDPGREPACPLSEKGKSSDGVVCCVSVDGGRYNPGLPLRAKRTPLPCTSAAVTSSSTMANNGSRHRVHGRSKLPVVSRVRSDARASSVAGSISSRIRVNVCCCRGQGQSPLRLINRRNQPPPLPIVSACSGKIMGLVLSRSSAPSSRTHNAVCPFAIVMGITDISDAVVGSAARRKLKGFTVGG